MSGKLNVFLCHGFEDKEAVRELYRKLLEDGFDPWLDEEKLLPGQDWELEIERAVKRADCFVVCLSARSVDRRGYVQREIQRALRVAEEQPEGAIFLIPARLEVCVVPDRLARWQWVDLFSARGYERLRLALLQRRGVHPPPSTESPESGFSGASSAAASSLGPYAENAAVAPPRTDQRGRADVADPVELGFMRGEGGNHRGVAVIGGVAYVGRGTDYNGPVPCALLAIDVSNPERPHTKNEVRLEGKRVLDVLHRDNTLFCSTEGSLSVIDVTSPLEPALVGRVEVDARTNSRLWVVNGDLWITSPFQGLIVVDISDPRRPRLKRTVSTLRGSAAAQIDERRVLVAGSSAATIFDIGNLALPKLLYTLEGAGGYDIDVEAGLFFIAAAGRGLQVGRVDPEPALIGACATPEYAHGVAVAGSAAYAACGSDGFVTFDVSDPHRPTLVSATSTGGWATSLALDSGRLYACGSRALTVFQLQRDF